MINSTRAQKGRGCYLGTHTGGGRNTGHETIYYCNHYTIGQFIIIIQLTLRYSNVGTGNPNEIGVPIGTSPN